MRQNRANSFKNVVQQPDAKNQGSPGQKTVKSYGNYKKPASKVNRFSWVITKIRRKKRTARFCQEMSSLSCEASYREIGNWLLIRMVLHRRKID